MKAAQLLQRFPDLIEFLRDGRLCMTSMAALSKVLTRDRLMDRYCRDPRQGELGGFP